MSEKKGSIGGFFLERLTTDSPETYTRLCRVFSMSGFGQTNSLEDVTTFCSEGSREYISGLADGKQVTIQLNYVGDNTDVEALIDMVANKETDTFRIVNENVTPNKYIKVDLVGIDWELQPSVDSKNVLALEFKISGAPERGELES